MIFLFELLLVLVLVLLVLLVVVSVFRLTKYKKKSIYFLYFTSVVFTIVTPFSWTLFFLVFFFFLNCYMFVISFIYVFFSCGPMFFFSLIFICDKMLGYTWLCAFSHQWVYPYDIVKMFTLSVEIVSWNCHLHWQCLNICTVSSQLWLQLCHLYKKVASCQLSKPPCLSLQPLLLSWSCCWPQWSWQDLQLR